MAKPLVILCDMDAIAVDLNAAWIPAINNQFDDNLTVDKLVEWDLAKFCKGGEAVYEILRAPGFFRNLPETPGARAALKEVFNLRQPDDSPSFYLSFLTSCHASPYAATDKHFYVQEHFPFLGSKDIITAYHKDTVKGDVLIDDSPRNLRQYARAWPEAHLITIDYPYNHKSKVDLRAMDYLNPQGAWVQIVWYLMNLANETGRLHDKHLARLAGLRVHLSSPYTPGCGHLSSHLLCLG